VRPDAHGRLKREVLCMPRYCPYASVCPTRGPKQRIVFAHECLRQAPAHLRPAAGLSPVALEALAKVRRSLTPGPSP